MTKHQSKGVLISAKAVGGVFLSTRLYLSMSHIAGACSSALRARDIETKGINAQFDSLEHKGAVSSCVMACGAFLEASINEFYCDAHESPSELQPLGEEAIRWLAKNWCLNFPRTASYATVQKYQIALTLVDRGALDFGRSPGQDIGYLVKLRNALVHYEPEWSSGEPESHSMAKMLSGRFPTNPLTGAGNPFYPDHCLSYGCCRWAVKSSLDFHRAFWIQLGLPGRHAHLYSALPTLP